MLDVRPLRSVTFRRLTASYLVNELGNTIAAVALALLVYDNTGSPMATAGLFLALRFVPTLAAQLLTSRVEIVPARRVLPLIFLTEAALYVALAIVARHFSLWAVLALASIDGALAVSARALMRSAVATHLRARELLHEGNAILNLVLITGTSLGPALGGVITAWRGVETAMLVNAATFVATAAILGGTRGLRIASDSAAGVAGRLRAGFSAIGNDPLVVRLFVVCGLALLVGSVAVPVEVVFARHTLHAGAAGYGFLLTTWTLGAVAGAAAFAAFPRKRVTAVLAGSALLIAIGFGGLALSPTLTVACAFSAVGGIGDGVVGVAAITAIQAAVPQTTQSVVMAALEGVNQIMPAIGFIAGGVITALTGPRVAYAAAAAGLLLVVAVAAIRTPRQADPNPSRVTDLGAQT